MFRHPGHRTPGNESGRKPATASDHRKEPPGRDKPLTQVRGKLTNMFRAHLSHELWDKWRKGQLDVSMRRNTPDGCEYEELPKEAADQILDGGEIHSCEDLADPTEVISDRYACSLYGITTFKPSEYAIEEDFPNEVVLLVRGWSVADFMSDWTKFDAVDD